MFFLKELPTRKMLEAYHDQFPAMNVDNVQAALYMLRRASILMRVLDIYFSNHGLSQLRYLIMVVLDREKGCEGLMASDVADRLDVSRPVMTRTLQTLASEGMLAVETHGVDARAKLIRLTNVGHKKLYEVLPGYYQLIDTFMKE